MPEKDAEHGQDPASTALAERKTHPLQRAEDHYSVEERQAIAKFLNVSAEDTALVPFLATAAQLDLSPIHGEIWLIKGRRKEGNQWVDFYRPAVGRDGLLKIAERSPRFKGVRFGVVCANDTFEVEDDGWETKVLHRMASLSATAEKGHESRWRGAVIGAWAKVYFTDDRPPLYYFAPAHEHVRTEERTKDGETKRVLAGAWSYTSTMIVKSAVSYVLRIGFGVTGVVPFDELRVDDPQMMGGAAGEAESFQSGSAGTVLGEDPSIKNGEFIDGLEGVSEGLREELKIALEQVNAIAPYSWSPSKVLMRVGSDCDEVKGKEVLAEVEAEFKALRDKEAEREKREAEAENVEEAIQVVLARDVKPPVELHVVPGDADNPEPEVPEWALVEDVIFDEDAGVMTFKLAGSREVRHGPTDEVEIRTPQAGTEQG